MRNYNNMIKTIDEIIDEFYSNKDSIYLQDIFEYMKNGGIVKHDDYYYRWDFKAECHVNSKWQEISILVYGPFDSNIFNRKINGIDFCTDVWECEAFGC